MTNYLLLRKSILCIDDILRLINRKKIWLLDDPRDIANRIETDYGKGMNGFAMVMYALLLED